MSVVSGRVLVIDDEAIVRESIVAYLEDSGFDVIEAENGYEGVACFNSQQPDIVLCDLRMPNMDGLTVLKQINKTHPNTPFIVVSGAGVMADVVQALRLGASDYLIKPILDMEVLEHSIVRNLKQRRLIEQNSAYRAQLESNNRELAARLEELRIDQQAGREVQKRMLPENQAQMTGIEFNYHIIPSLYLSGDFVDYFPVSSDKVVFYIADVSGHGASSAFITVLLKNLSNRLRRNLKRQSSDDLLTPHKVIKRINKELVEAQLGKHVSLFWGMIDLPSTTLSYSVAGQFPMPILSNENGVHYLEGRSQPAGLFAAAQYETYDVKLGQSFQLVAVSDGILEVLPHTSLAEKEACLLEWVTHGQLTIENLESLLKIDTGNEIPDDITLLTLSRTE
ncbi:response regulator [Bermanella sp. WJH001]|uniref:response regulator n=1 Tax=Bermanella sp. WJH001 TaxID=3048005 RepID=UPI0024BD767F|nr:response regulator [Bermanella sp. WJH001]MDJ1537653.1 response regulator [Bermanella sp. WJH001]